MEKLMFNGRVKDIIPLMKYDDYLLSQVDKVWETLGKNYQSPQEWITFNESMKEDTGFSISDEQTVNLYETRKRLFYEVDPLDRRDIDIAQLKKFLTQKCEFDEHYYKTAGWRSHVNDFIQCEFYPSPIKEVRDGLNQNL